MSILLSQGHHKQLSRPHPATRTAASPPPCGGDATRQSLSSVRAMRVGRTVDAGSLKVAPFRRDHEKVQLSNCHSPVPCCSALERCGWREPLFCKSASAYRPFKRALLAPIGRLLGLERWVENRASGQNFGRICIWKALKSAIRRAFGRPEG
jgi:hypothetical protein